MKPVLVALLAAGSCQTPVEPDPRLIDIFSLSPMEAMPSDPTNGVADHPTAAELGEALFFDTRLSLTGDVSCATCHIPEQGFADGKTLSTGLDTTERHTPSTLNTGWSRWFFWDGRADSAWAQSLKPIEAENEHGFNRTELAHLIHQDNALREPYETVFGALPDLDDGARFPTQASPFPPYRDAWNGMSATDQDHINRVFTNAGKAIAAFERTLNRTDAPFDRYVEALRNEDPNASDHISDDAIVGLDLFIGRGNCILCHSGPTLSDLQFHNLGLTPPAWMDPTDRGRYDGIISIMQDPFNGAGAYSDDPDAGEEKIKYMALDSERLGQFKTPSLRNVALTPPYMHGGQLATLEEVVEFYNLANQEPTIGHRDELLLPLELTEAEKRGLVAFLESLTGDPP